MVGAQNPKYSAKHEFEEERMAHISATAGPCPMRLGVFRRCFGWLPDEGGVGEVTMQEARTQLVSVF
jgi:hypothetical protein